MVVLTLLWAVVMGLLAACGEDDGEGGGPDLFLGLSGVVIAVLVIWGISRAIRKRGVTTPAYQLSAAIAVLDRAHREYHRQRRIRLAAAAIRHVLLTLAVVGLLAWNWYAWEMLCRAIDAHLGLDRYWA